MALSPAQNHEVEFPIALVDQVPSVPAKEHSWLNDQQDIMLTSLHCTIQKYFTGVQGAHKVTVVGKKGKTNVG